MGSWEETCAITRLPIYEDDPVVVVMPHIELMKIPNAAPWGWYHSQAFWEANKSIEAIHYGSYDSYGWIKEATQPKSIDYVVFIHRSAWDKIQGMKEIVDAVEQKLEHQGPQLPCGAWFINKPKVDPQLLLEFDRVMHFAQESRISLVGGWEFKGKPADGSEERLYPTLKKITDLRIKEIKKLSEDR